MNTFASDVMSSDLTMVSVDTSVEVAEQRMIERSMRCVPVVDDNRQIFGVLSFADVRKQRQNNVNIKTISVWEICSHKVFSVPKQASLHAVIDVMVENSIHHVLVLEDSRPVGIISAMDILQHYRGESVELKVSEARAAARMVESTDSINKIYRL